MDDPRPDDEITRLFDGIKAFEPEATVVDWPARERAQWKARMDAEDEARYGTTPRSEWPPNARWWPNHVRREADYWIQKLYGEQGLTGRYVADLTNLTEGMIKNRVRALGLHRGRKMGVGHMKARQAEQRRRLVRQLHENGASVREIAVELGWNDTTIGLDLKALGLPTKPPPRKSGLTAEESWEMIDNSVRQLTGVARLAMGARLSNPEAREDTLREWDKNLTEVVVAVRKLRKTMKGNDDE